MKFGPIHKYPFRNCIQRLRTTLSPYLWSLPSVFTCIASILPLSLALPSPASHRRVSLYLFPMRAPVAVNHTRPPPLSSNLLTEKCSRSIRRNPIVPTRCLMGTTIQQGIKTFNQHKNRKAFKTHALIGSNSSVDVSDTFDVSELRHSLYLADLDPATAKLAIGFIGPFLSAFAFLFIVRIVMSWYPKLPVSEFPYVLAYAPTEPILIPTRKVIPPLGGVDITPVVWFGLLSFLNEILVGPQGLLVLISQQR